MPSNNPVFVDTSGWIALLNADDHFHTQAIELMNQFAHSQCILVSTDWVFAEKGNGLTRTRARRGLFHAVDAFLQSAHGQLVRIEADLFGKALETYKGADDKTWGLVDCASFVVMREAHIDSAMTSDHHFEQAGFRSLLPTR